MPKAAKEHSGRDSEGQLPWATDDPKQKDEFGAFMREGSEQWTTLYETGGDVGSFSGARWSALLPKSAAPPTESRWELSIGGGVPGFSQIYSRGRSRTKYELNSSSPAEALVHYRDFHGLRPAYPELSEQFRLLFNLWESRKTGEFFYFDGSGNPIKAAEVHEKRVRVLTSLIRRYQAVRQLCLALYIDSTLFSSSLPLGDYDWQLRDDAHALDYYRGAGSGSSRFSRLFGKKLFRPPARRQCGLWPYEAPRQFEDFIISVNDVGLERLHTSDPDRLANYFGKNPTSPHYLTPVFFRREVLDRYYADTDRFEVEDGMVRCAGLWVLRLDNDRPEHVMVFLGDLGRDIPHDEARYWRSFNIPPPENGASETLLRRAFLGQFADAQSVDLRFARIYEMTNRAWEEKYGWPLFKPLHKDDRHVLAKLHVPAGDGQAEFDEQVLYLAKLVVDSLNEKELRRAAGPGPKGEKGLGKLQRFLESAGIRDAEALIAPLAHVQGLRSRGAAHRKGSDFDITVAIGDLGRRAGFERLLSQVASRLETLLTATGSG